MIYCVVIILKTNCYFGCILTVTYLAIFIYLCLDSCSVAVHLNTIKIAFVVILAFLIVSATARSNRKGKCSTIK